MGHVKVDETDGALLPRFCICKMRSSANRIFARHTNTHTHTLISDEIGKK